MTYFLDFDMTLFDTRRFLPYLFAKPACAGLSVPPFVELARDLATLVGAGKLSFAEGELAQFLYPDVAAFVETHPCVIVTAGPVMWQAAKVANALPGVRAIYTDDAPKGPFVEEAAAGTPGPVFFVDDRPGQLNSVRDACPAAAIFEMRRDDADAQSTYPVVRSLSELAEPR